MNKCISLYRFITLAFFALIFNAGVSQAIDQPIRGRIKSAEGPLPGVNVLLLHANDSALVKGEVTKPDGSFLFESVQPGRYFISATMVGYQRKRMGVFSVDVQPVDIGEVVLEEQINQLTEAIVTAEKFSVDVQDDKIIVNVGNSIVNAGGTALDILERSPGISVNQNGGITMRGKEGVIVMMDGRPTPLSAADVTAMLRSMPSESIDKIELITNPSARYDAAGSAGIINIKLKKDQRLGTNGSFTLGYGQGRYAKPNAGISVNHREKKFNIFGTYNIGYRKNFRDLSISRKFRADGQVITDLQQETFTVFNPLINTARLGVDFFTNEKTVMGVLVDYTNVNNRNNNGRSRTAIDDGQNNRLFLVESAERSNNFRDNVNINFNYKRKLKKEGEELNVDVDYTRFSNDTKSNYPILNTEGAIPAGFNITPFLSVQARSFNVYAMKADYKIPLKKSMLVESGLKISFVENDNNIRFEVDGGNGFENDPTRTNQFVYSENINAAYVNFRKTEKRWSLQAGLRVEQTIGRGEQRTTGQKINRNFSQLFPSFTVGKSIGKKDRIVLSYSRRITRPEFNQLNPFKFYTDPFAYNTGNPLLLPTLTHSLELSYNVGEGLIITGSYSETENFIATLFQREEGSNIQEEMPFNFEKRLNYSLSFTVPLKITTWWTTNSSFTIYRNVFDGTLAGNDLTNSRVTVSGNSVNTLSLGKGFTVEVSGNVRSRVAFGPNVVGNFGQLTMGVAKSIFKERGTLRLTMADIFYTQIIQVEAENQNPEVSIRNAGDSRVGNIVFTYRFGSKTVGQNRNRQSGAEDIRSRIGG